MLVLFVKHQKITYNKIYIVVYQSFDNNQTFSLTSRLHVQDQRLFAETKAPQDQTVA